MEKEHFGVLPEEIRGSLQLLADGHMALVARFDGVDARFDGVDAKFERIDARLDRVDARLARVEADGRATRDDVARIADGFADHEQRITKLAKRRR